MLLCSTCPDNPACSFCLHDLGAGEMAQKVIPPRPITLVHLSSGKRLSAQLRAVSRLAIGVYTEERWPPGRYEVELAADFRIIGNSVSGVQNSRYFVIDIEKVLRRDDILERLLLEEFHSWHLSHELEPTEILDSLKDLDNERYRMIKEELHKLTILRQLQEIFMYMWEKDAINPLGNAKAEVFNQLELMPLVEKALTSQAPLREQRVSLQFHQIYDVHIVPLTDQTCGIVIINVTEAIAAERERQSQEWELYREVLSHVTQGKMALLRDSELYQLIRNGKKCFSMTISAPEDLAGLRMKLRNALTQSSVSAKKILHYIVAVNEAATNTLQHGGRGAVDVYLYGDEEVCRAVIYDQGRGILLTELPKATLLNGFSTRNTLGAGFHVMLQYTDKLWINSSTVGTKIVLELQIAEKNV